MPLTGRIFLVLFAMVLTLGLVLDNPRSFAVRPPSHLDSAHVVASGQGEVLAQAPLEPADP